MTAEWAVIFPATRQRGESNPAGRPRQKKKDGITPVLPKSTIPWCFDSSTTERSISDHHHIAGHHRREARGADEQGCDHHKFTSFGWLVPG
jgi:hypothetical protein